MGAPAVACALAQLPLLAALNLEGNALTDADLETLAPRLARLTRLTRLDLSDNAFSAAAWWHVVTHPLPASLRDLDMSGCSVAHAPRPRWVPPMAAMANGDAAAAAIASCVTLTRLVWEDAPPGAEHPGAAVARLPQLASLAYPAWSGDAWFPEKLVHLDLYWQPERMSAQQAEALGGGLSRLPRAANATCARARV